MTQWILVFHFARIWAWNIYLGINTSPTHFLKHLCLLPSHVINKVLPSAWKTTQIKYNRVWHISTNWNPARSCIDLYSFFIRLCWILPLMSLNLIGCLLGITKYTGLMNCIWGRLLFQVSLFEDEVPAFPCFYSPGRQRFCCTRRGGRW